MNASNETISKIRGRKSIRRFKTDNIPKNIVDEILLSGQRAPSSCNHQTYTFILIENPIIRKEIMNLCKGQSFIKNAPVWVVICSDMRRLIQVLDYLKLEHCFKYGYGLTEILYSLVDSSLAAENMVIAAESFGLGSVFIGDILFYAEKISQILKLPEKVLPLLLLCIGYPAENPPLRPRWSIDSVVSTDKYEDVTNGEISAFLKHTLKHLEKEQTDKSPEDIEKEFMQDLIGHTDLETHRKHDPNLSEYLKKLGFIPKY